MCISQRYYFVVCFTIARESDIHFFFAMVHIYIRYIDAFVKRIALTQIFAGKSAGGAVLILHRASRVKSVGLPALQPYQMRL